MTGPWTWLLQVAAVTRFGLMSVPRRLGAVAATVIGIAGVVGVLETPPLDGDRAYRDQIAMLRKMKGAAAPKARSFALQPTEPVEPKPAPLKKAPARKRGGT